LKENKCKINTAKLTFPGYFVKAVPPPNVELLTQHFAHFFPLELAAHSVRLFFFVDFICIIRLPLAE